VKDKNAGFSTSLCFGRNDEFVVGKVDMP